MIVLGVNAYHGDTSAALFVDGDLVAAAEEERFTRVKHDSGLPVEAAAWALREAGLSLADVDHVAVSKNPHTHKARRVVRAAEHLVRSRSFPEARIRSFNRITTVKEDLRLALGQSDFDMHYVEHHPAHIASAFYASPFEDAAICSVDGLGDHVSMAWGSGSGTHLDVRHRVFFPHSLGFFYTAITQFLGFPHYGDEYKVMGLAPYGTPSYIDAMRAILHVRGKDFALDMKYFRHGNSKIDWNFEGGAPVLGAMFARRMEDLLGPARVAADEPLTQRHRDIAASAQLRLEEVLLPILRRVQQQTRSPRLALAGGVALNVTANTKICDVTGFREVYIPPAANDAGTSVGAGLYVMHEELGRPRNFEMVHAYYGPAFDDDECVGALEAAELAYERVKDEDLAFRTAELIAAGKIVGWFQGRMEFGPRALGNRSIVCDPRRADMKEILNSRTKRREAFRPFAPSVLLERVEEVYDFSGSSPFMLMAPKVRAEWAHKIPAVTHVDGTGRIQTVDRETNPRYWELLSAFNDLTGVPVVLNTSFNENEPIVCTPEEAIACYLRADMDVLVLGNCLVTARE